MSIFSQDLLENEISLIAKVVLDQKNETQIVFFEGEPGAGKTTLINEILQQMGLNASASPTFSLHNRISGKDRIIDHFDLYRIESVDELETTGIWDVISECQAGRNPNISRAIFIEWANKFDSGIWPLDIPLMTVKITNGKKANSRHYQIMQIR